MGQLGEIAEIRVLLRALMDEAVNVAGALEISLPVSVERRFEAAFSVGDHRTSMLQDLEAGKPLEFECMTGAVLELAHRLDGGRAEPYGGACVDQDARRGNPGAGRA